MRFRWLLAVMAMAMFVTANGAWSWQGGKELATWRAGGLNLVANTAESITYVSTCDDPMMHSPIFDKRDASIDEVVVIRAKIWGGGKGELFHARNGEEWRHPQRLAKSFEWIGDGEWHEYRIRPSWEGKPCVRQIRLDMPAKPGVKVEIAAIRVENDPIANLPLVGEADPKGGVAFTCEPVDRTAWAQVEWMGDEVGEAIVRRAFHLIGDGKMRRYYFDGSRATDFEGNGYSEKCTAKWHGKLRKFKVTNLNTGKELKLKDVEFTHRKPEMPGELCLSATEIPLAFNRAGQPFYVDIGLFNPGTLPVNGATCEISGLPEGVRLVDPQGAKKVVDLPAWNSALHRFAVLADRPCEFRLKAEFRYANLQTSITIPVKVGENLNLPKASAIPEPKPLKPGKFEIGAFYFMDWVRPEHWMKIWRIDPKRKPALGWYCNLNPDVLDWQIKWAVENGISYYLVDWYGAYGWHSLAYFEDAFKKARFRKYMKWALMWCNHMPKGSCSEQAWDWLVDYWIKHCFTDPQYMRVDGKPYVSIWDPDNIDRDNWPNGCKRLLDKARAKARAAGYPGIYFQAMNNEDHTPAHAARLQEKRREQGFDETVQYHYLGTNAKVDENGQKHFGDVVGSSWDTWKTLDAAKGIRYLPNLSTGWFDWPWNDGSEVKGKGVAEFRRLCELARRFGEETGNCRFCLAPLNEWGEGSYAEPNGEFGFGMFEAIRETFFEKPTEGWPINYTPEDVGLGPYPVPGFGGVVPQTNNRIWR